MKAEDIAASLSEAQRVVLRNAGYAYGSCPYDISLIRPLERQGLMQRTEEPGFRPHWHLTDSGEAVRSHLMKERGE